KIRQALVGLWPHAVGLWEGTLSISARGFFECQLITGRRGFFQDHPDFLSDASEAMLDLP
ncbi:hypothetical protein RA263_28175, partial [Pseudomonas syringae pv. tagetis]|uniref:hypothetical protein n=1 Tax=Pseudomonas syringae group genomosp. 7 TaxID=251699 RepID=UPI0037700398